MADKAPSEFQYNADKTLAINNNFTPNESNNFGTSNALNTQINPFTVTGNGRAVGETPDKAIKTTYNSDMKSMW